MPLVFALFIAIGAVLAWMRPWRKLHQDGRETIGATAFVGSGGLRKGASGEVTWSGTIRQAELSKECAVDAVEAGAEVKVLGVNGIRLIVTPLA